MLIGQRAGESLCVVLAGAGQVLALNGVACCMRWLLKLLHS